MASKTERTTINAAGLVQGIVLVTFPAASTIFTSKSQYGLSSSQYGTMFLPQVALAIAASLLGARLARRITAKRVYLTGLACSLVSMVLLLASTLIKANQAAAYPLLLVATAFLGAGFGLTVPLLNTYTSVFHPDSADRAVLMLNALLGLGTALAPVLVAIFVGLGFWWGLPILSTVLLLLLLLVSVRLPLGAGAQPGAAWTQPTGCTSPSPLAIAAPYGTGSHPYLTAGTPVVDECELTVPATYWLPTDERGIPSGPAEPAEGTAYDFRKGRAIGTTRLDHALTGLDRDGDGRAWAHLAAGSDTESGVRLWAGEGYRWLQVVTGDPLPPDLRRKALAVEPMTCPPNAFVTGHDLLILEPGQAVTSTWGITTVLPFHADQPGERQDRSQHRRSTASHGGTSFRSGCCCS
jgi:Aldose 1-epimerase/Major Facilitator Superfamily